LFAGYTAAKRRQNVLDYDDLLLYWAEMLSDKEVAREIGGRFDHILVDEYQDTNRLQAKILLRLKPDGRGLMVVGDDAQAIYSFRAATVRNILDFPDRFKPQQLAAVARARGIRLDDNVVTDSMSYVDTLPANSTTSLQRDIAEGKPSELDYWNGAVVRQGRAVEVSTPVHQFIYHSLLPQESRARGKLVFPQ
jgi:DNA helicase-2/ATP-dependent DNA helicase PcrA